MKAIQQTGYLVAGAVLLTATGAQAGGLPQIDPTWFRNELLWLAVSFCVLYGFVSRLIAPSINNVLTIRENAINEAIADAERAKSAAESTLGNAASTSQSARSKASELLAAAQAATSADAAQALAKLDHDLARKTRQASAVLEEAVQKASKNVDEASQSLAEAMAAKLLGADATLSAPLKLVMKR
ncbi:MAG: hypothetical protein V4735_01495 [Pseudomonadota bacterium]